MKIVWVSLVVFLILGGMFFTWRRFNRFQPREILSTQPQGFLGRFFGRFQDKKKAEDQVTVTPTSSPFSRTTSPTPVTQTTLTTNPFGLMISASGITVSQRTQIAKSLGAVYYRPLAVFIDRWNGSCPECDEALKAGLKLVLTVRNGSGGGTPSHFPQDLNAYQKKIGEILDKYRPDLLVVENEENSILFYDGTPEQYHQELKAACAVAHERGLKCANGGLVSSLVSLLVADDYENSEKNPTKADQYLQRTLRPEVYQRLKNNSTGKKQQVEKGQSLVSGYRAAGADFINFHWYVADTNALTEAVAYLGRASELPVLTNETGQQQNENPAQVTSVMGKILELSLPIAIWYSIDTASEGSAQALINTDGSLRPNGEAYQNFIQENFR